MRNGLASRSRSGYALGGVAPRRSCPPKDASFGSGLAGAAALKGGVQS